VTIRTQELADILVAGVSDGIPLRELCRRHSISKSEVYRWRADDAAFEGRFVRAREEGFDAIAEEAMEIADDGTNDWEKRNREDGSTEDVLNHEHVQRSKLRIETRLKLLAKWDPKRYGDLVKLGNADGSNLDTTAALQAARERALGDRG
jgi:hypothetical protein